MRLPAVLYGAESPSYRMEASLEGTLMTQTIERRAEIWTDGGCKPNPGPGGWATVIREDGGERTLSGGEAATTNNRMELIAAASALESLTPGTRAILHTDSEYLRLGVT